MIGSAGDGVFDFISDLKLSQFVVLTSIGLIGLRLGRPELIRMVNGRWSDRDVREEELACQGKIQDDLIFGIVERFVGWGVVVE